MFVFVTGVIGRNGEASLSERRLRVYLYLTTLLCLIDIGILVNTGYHLGQTIYSMHILETNAQDDKRAMVIRIFEVVIELLCLKLYIFCRSHAKALIEELGSYAPIRIIP
jgi:hypothetical protein